MHFDHLPPRSSLFTSNLLALACVGVLACGDGRNDDNADEVSGTGDATASESQSGSGEQEGAEQDGSSSDTQSTDASTSDTASETASDTASETASGTASETASDTASDTTSDTNTSDTGLAEFCDKVDFLFVIDNSISMLPEQDALSASFPAFIDAIEGSLDTDDHILVADTDLVGWCTPGECADPGSLHPTCEGPDSYACTGTFDECDITLGAGVVRPAGQGASNTFCDPFGGNRYLVETEPDKVGKFDCMAHVGLAGFPLERPVDAIVQALSPNLEQVGGCNEAFLRDDAILVVTFVSDDDGNNEVNTMQEAYDQIVAAKGGDEDRIIMLGLIPAPDNNCSGTPGAGEHWLSLIDMFGDRGLHAPSCADDYVDFFQGAVDVIVEACKDNPQ